HGVALGGGFRRPGRGDPVNGGAVHLMDGDKGASTERRAHALPVFRHVVLLVIGAEAAIEPGIKAGGDAPFAGEEAMGHAGQRRQVWALDHGAVSNPAGVGQPGAVMAMALNMLPICSVSTSRWQAVAMALRCAFDVAASESCLERA